VLKDKLLIIKLFIFATCAVSFSAFATNVIMETPLGNIEIELFDEVTPGTVENFLNYVNDGDYEDSFVHRSVPGFVIQGGGFTFEAGQATAIPTDPPIENEFELSNVRGTIKCPGNDRHGKARWKSGQRDQSMVY